MRQVFLPMSYLYSKKHVHPLTPTTRSLRDELYTQPYSSINFSAHRNTINPGDNYHPKSPLLNSINWFLVNIHLPYLRVDPLKQRAESYTYQLIQYEDENTDFGCLAPVNSPINTICRYITDGPESHAFRRHIERLDDFLWMKDEGLLCNGTNGVQTWDTSFAIQAAVSVPGIAEHPRWRPMLTRALEFVEDQQIREECRCQAQSYRQSRKGAWAFSTRDQGYTVSDCTSEALKSVLLLQKTVNTPEGKYPQLVSVERTKQAVDVLLTMQNASGGFASYEPTRGSAWLMEQLNAAEVFGRIMVEYDYPECTTAVVTALSLFSKFFPDYRKHDIQSTVEKAVGWIRKDQRADGSWYGSWGICFTYAGMFALESLASVGETYENSERVRRACKFFIDKQNEDGGWGESYKSCEDAVWRDHSDGSQVVQTAWVVIALLEAGYEDDGGRVMERAVRLIMGRQQANGEWLQEGIEGVFNKTW